MKKMTLILLTSLFAFSAHAFEVNIGQKVQIEDASALVSDSTLNNGTYHTVTGARKLSNGAIEITLEMFFTAQDLRDGIQSGLVPSQISSKVYAMPNGSITTLKGLKVID